MKNLLPDSFRLAIGTLTRIPVPAPRSVTRSTAGRAILLAPAVGFIIAAISGVPLLIPGLNTGGAIFASVVTIGALTLLTRALHWDGLADTVDALASGKPAPSALQIARRSDLGPVGAIAIMTAFALQVSALTVLVAPGTGYLAWIVACTAGRAGLVFACDRSVPAARTDGLGSAVSRSVPRPAVIFTGAVIAIVSAVGLATLQPVYTSTLAGPLAAWLIIRRARRSLGGITGDVLGAIVEVGATVVLVGAAFGTLWINNWG